MPGLRGRLTSPTRVVSNNAVLVIMVYLTDVYSYKLQEISLPAVLDMKW
jgi:hypothetical protein